MSTFHWRETLKAIKPPLFTRMGCSLFVMVLAMGFVGLLIAGLNQYAALAFLHDDAETSRKLTDLTIHLLENSPIVIFVLAVIAFFESVDFLIWLKLPLYPPKPAPPPDPLEAFKPPKE